MPLTPEAPVLLVMCTANICRSPMAEALMVHHINRLKLKANVISRGLNAPIGREPHPYAIKIAETQGIPIHPAKRSAQVTSADMAIASMVFVMESSHRRQVQERFPTAAGKTFLLGHWQKAEISDPVNQPMSAFEQAWRQCDLGTQEWMRCLCEAGILRMGV